MTELRFQFEVFEGPLDLLLHLVRKEEVDIYEVDMVKIADQFCEYVELMKRFDLHLAGEFIVMASTLMYIKSKELLPVDQQVVVEDEDEDDRREKLRLAPDGLRAAFANDADSYSGSELRGAATQAGAQVHVPVVLHVPSLGFNAGHDDDREY